MQGLAPSAEGREEKLGCAPVCSPTIMPLDQLASCLVGVPRGQVGQVDSELLQKGLYSFGTQSRATLSGFNKTPLGLTKPPSRHREAVWSPLPLCLQSNHACPLSKGLGYVQEILFSKGLEIDGPKHPVSKTT